MGLVKRPDMNTENETEVDDSVVSDQAAVEEVEEVEVVSEISETEEVPPESEPTTAVATHTATPLATPGIAFAASAAEEGMEGLDIGYGSFPNIKLDNGVFIDGDGKEYGTSITFTPMASRAVHAYSQKNEKDGDVCFSYDQKVTSKGEEISTILAEWVADGFEVKEDVRLEVTAQLDTDEIVMLSLPPTARKKFSGQMAVARARGISMAEAGLTARVGKPVKVGSRTFQPWIFSLAA